MNKKLRSICFLIAIVLIHTNTVADNLSGVYDAALEGNMVKAFSTLDAIDANKLTEKEATAAECLRKTFAVSPQAEALPPLSQKILTAYRHYW